MGHRVVSSLSHHARAIPLEVGGMGNADLRSGIGRSSAAGLTAAGFVGRYGIVRVCGECSILRRRVDHEGGCALPALSSAVSLTDSRAVLRQLSWMGWRSIGPSWGSRGWRRRSSMRRRCTRMVRGRWYTRVKQPPEGAPGGIPVVCCCRPLVGTRPGARGVRIDPDGARRRSLQKGRAATG